MKQRFRKNLLVVFGTLLLLVVLIADKPSQASSAYGATGSLRQASEYQIKAVYLYNFLLFTEWPKTESPKKDDQHNSEAGVDKKPLDTICIGILGNDPFGDSFDDVEGKVIECKGKKFVVKRYGPYSKEMDFKRCQVLFVSSSEKRNIKRILSRLKKVSVLTVADMDGYIESGGMINFVKVGRKIRWEINCTPVKLAGLKLSSQLLRNAVRIVEIPKLPAAKRKKPEDRDSRSPGR